MVTVEVDPKFHGPTLVEIGPTLDGIPDNPLRVGWGGTKDEIRLVEDNPDRDFIVCVPSLPEMGQAAFLLGAPIQMGAGMVTRGRDALADRKSYDWKRFSADVGPSVTRSLVVKLAADAIRQGLRPRLAGVAFDVMQGKVNPADADVLIRSKS